MSPVESDFPFGSPTRSGRARLVRLFAFVAVLAAALAAAWWATRERQAPRAEAIHNHAAAPAADTAVPVRLSHEDAQRIGVTFAEATLGPVQRKVRTVAQVTFDESRVTTVSLRIDGWVDQLFVNFTGQQVRKGDALLSLYSPMLVSAQQEFLLSRRLRQEVSRGTPDAVTGADDLLQSARRRLAYWEVPAADIQRLEETGEVRKTITLRSPTEGVVVEKNVQLGQRIMAGDVLYRVADLSRVWLEGEVFEQDIAAVRLGQEVTAEFTALPGDTRRGRISYVYPTLNPETRTARVRVELANASRKLKPGMYATIWFSSAAERVLSVPRSALLSTGKRDLVFVRNADGTLQPRDVVLGFATDDRVQVLRGLAPGETIVASATFLIDAESNLASALAGMAGMPGMDVPAPTKDEPPNAPLTPDQDHSSMQEKE